MKHQHFMADSIVVNAVRNKLVHRICAVIRNNKPYEVRTVAAN